MKKNHLKTELAIKQHAANRAEAEKIAAETGRTAILLIESNMGSDDTHAFEAFHEVDDFAKALNYSTGSMEREFPIACARDIEYIAKWTNINHRKEGSRIGAVIVGEDKRNGTVSLYEFQKQVEATLPLCSMCECKCADCAHGNLRGSQSCYDTRRRHGV